MESNDIKDFGAVLDGAKKHNYTLSQSIRESIDIGAVPLSKSIPQPNYEKLIGDGLDPKMAAYIAQIRDYIPTKPQKSYKLVSWVSEVEAARKIIGNVLDGTITFDNLQESFGAESWTRPGTDKNRADILRLADDLPAATIKDLAKYTLAEHHYSIFHNEKDVNKWVVSDISQAGGMGGMRNQKHYDAKAEALDYIKNVLAGESEAEAKKIKFDLWTEKSRPGVFVGKKISSTKFIELQNFDDVKAARAYVAENYQALVDQLKDRKELREIRRTKNADRIGEDYRKGNDVTPAQFDKTFGFRGVQFGNWVENDRRQLDLNNAYDALLDLSNVLQLPPKAMSLNGALGFAFGARGSGGIDPASAHYEPDTVVINLTKERGAGSLAHEWFHALDNHFGKIEAGKVDSYGTELNARKARIIEGHTYRDAKPEDFALNADVFKAWRGITETLKSETAIHTRSAELDSARSKDYWSLTHEVTARSFESYVIDKLAMSGNVNDYLANIVDEKTHNAANALLNSNQSFPYILRSEMLAITKAYDAVFETIKAHELDKLVVDDKPKSRLTTEQREEALNIFADKQVNNISKDNIGR